MMDSQEELNAMLSSQVKIQTIVVAAGNFIFESFLSSKGSNKSLNWKLIANFGLVNRYVRAWALHLEL